MRLSSSLAFALLIQGCGILTPEAKEPWVYPTPDGAMTNQGTSRKQPRARSAAKWSHNDRRAERPVMRSWANRKPEGKHTPLVLNWPVAAIGVTSLYGPRTDPMAQKEHFHYGVDLSADYGTTVVAAGAGRVVRANWNRGHGRQIVIQHRAGYRTSYSHLSQIIVQPGAWVRGGETIGLIGNSGRSTGPHLHLEVTRFGRHLDPLDCLGVPLEK